MAFKTFIPLVESNKLLITRDKYLIFADHCTREYAGDVAQLGDEIKIKGIGTPTVYTMQKDGTYAANAVGTGSIAGTGKDVIHKGIPDAEEIDGNEVRLKVNQIYAWNFMIGDIDKALVKNPNGKSLFGKYRTKLGKQIANMQDKYVAKVITGFNPCELKKYPDGDALTAGTGIYLKSGDTDTTAHTNAGAWNILDFVDTMLEEFNTRDFNDDEKFYVECSPKFWRHIKKALRNVDQNNTVIVRGRKCVEYNGFYFTKTNNAVVEGTEYVVFRTKDSVAFFDPLTHNEPYRPDKGFADALKGFNLFDAGIVDPKGIIWAKVVGYDD